MRRVVITGMGALTPIGNNLTDYWNALKNGKSGAAPITRFDASAFRTRFACEVKNFDPLQFMEKSDVKRTDLFTQFAFAVVNECIADAGIDLSKLNLNNIGVVWGSGMGGMMTYEEGMFDFFKHNKIPRFSPFFIPKLIPNITSGQLSIKYGLRGPSYSIASACTSGNNAIADAFNLIRGGQVDAIFAGGSEAPICMGPIGGFNAMRALSEQNDSPQTASRPFDKNRDGFVLGEGAGVLLIEELDHAQKRGAKIYCELAACGLASDGYHVTSPHPDGLGAIIAIEQALRIAGMQPTDVNYINAHATATPLGDVSECKAILSVFGKCLDSLAVSATKSMTGHLMGAAGAIEAIACVMAMHDGIVPPTINFTQPDDAIDQNISITAGKYAKKEIKVALNNTFGFGGHIVVSLFKKFEK